MNSVAAPHFEADKRLGISEWLLEIRGRFAEDLGTRLPKNNATVPTLGAVGREAPRKGCCQQHASFLGTRFALKVDSSIDPAPANLTQPSARVYMVTIVGKSQWTKEQIAALSDLQVARLNYDEMVEVVLASGVPLRDFASVRTVESAVLVRLVHWSRQFCRGQAT